MTKLIPIFILILSCLAADVYQPHRRNAFRQVQAGGWVDTRYPTNITGYPVNAYWEGAGYNGSGTWTDYSTNGYNLTNLAAGAFPTTETVNGRTVAVFSGSAQWLTCKLYTNDVNTEFVILWYPMMDDTAGGNRIITDGGGVTRVRRNVTTYYPYFFGVSGVSIIGTNVWFVYNITNAATHNDLYTNLVYHAGGPGTAATITDGISVGGRFSDGVNGAKMKIAELIVYNTNLTTAIRLNLFQYFTNKYAITP